jgi:hypothetical protein
LEKLSNMEFIMIIYVVNNNFPDRKFSRPGLAVFPFSLRSKEKHRSGFTNRPQSKQFACFPRFVTLQGIFPYRNCAPFGYFISSRTIHKIPQKVLRSGPSPELTPLTALTLEVKL